jgi:hypothetical protein
LTRSNGTDLKIVRAGIELGPRETISEAQGTSSGRTPESVEAAFRIVGLWKDIANASIENVPMRTAGEGYQLGKLR